MASATDYHLNHPQLGELVGFQRGDDIVQFRGIPFAEIPGRFRQATLLESLPSTPFNAQQPGAYCPQPLLPFPPYWEGKPVDGYPELRMPSMDEFACLNVDITAPRSAVEGDKKADVPVLFYVHGGAYVGGSHSIQVSGRELYDGTDLVRASIAASRPIVLISCNYRVGPLGFLASSELAALNQSHNEAVGNYGLHDQRQALEWCSRFIGGFGGDANAVTISGTSAGGSSVHFQSIFPGQRKFKRVIASSGTVIGIDAMNMAYHQKYYNAHLVKLGSDIDGLDGLDVVQKLQQLPVDSMIQPVTNDICYPLIDGEWVKGPRMSDIELPRPSDEVEPELMVGSCAFEEDLTEMVIMDMATGKPLVDDKMQARIQTMFASNGLVNDAPNFPPESIAKAYGLENTRKTPSVAYKTWSELMADMAFRVSALHVALAHRSSDVFVYTIEATNPYPKWATSFGRANHAINDLFVFNAAEDQVPDELREGYTGAVKQMRSAWLDFCHGIKPWQPFNRDNDTLGPIFTFQNGPTGRLGRTLEEAVGEQKAARLRAILKSEMRA